jgi:hypothetical protein
MKTPYDPDANITLRMAAAEAEWYQAGLAKRKLSPRPVQVLQPIAMRVRRISEGVLIFRTLFLQPRMPQILTR